MQNTDEFECPLSEEETQIDGRRRTEKKEPFSPLEIYMREISVYPLLTAEQEQDLAKRIADGDREAKQELTKSNLRLAVNIARDYVGKGLELQDLIEEANLGLLRAVDGFDASFGTRFSTYATYWMKHFVRQALRDKARTVRIPAYMLAILAKWRKCASDIKESTGRYPSAEEIAAALNMTKKQAEYAIKAMRVYANTNVLGDDDDMALEDLVFDPNEEPEDALARDEDLREMRDNLTHISPRDLEVLRLRFGLDGEEPKVLKEIGEKLGITRERVRQIEAQALVELYDMSEKGQGSALVDIAGDGIAELKTPHTTYEAALQSMAEVDPQLVHTLQFRGNLFIGQKVLSHTVIGNILKTSTDTVKKLESTALVMLRKQPFVPPNLDALQRRIDIVRQHHPDSVSVLQMRGGLFRGQIVVPIKAAARVLSTKTNDVTPESVLEHERKVRNDLRDVLV